MLPQIAQYPKVSLRGFQLFRFTIVWNRSCEDEHAEDHLVFAKDLDAATEYAQGYARCLSQGRSWATFDRVRESWEDENATWQVDKVVNVSLLQETILVAGAAGTIALEQVVLREDPVLLEALSVALELLSTFAESSWDENSVGWVKAQQLDLNDEALRARYQRLQKAMDLPMLPPAIEGGAA